MSLTASEVQHLCRETARQLAESRHTLVGLEALFQPVMHACSQGWGSMSVTGHYGERIVLDQLRRRLEDLTEAAEVNERCSRRAGGGTPGAR